VLGRSRLFGLETPKAMLSAASQLKQEFELSRTFRWEAMQATTALPRPPHLYLNTHPLELVEPGLLESMEALRKLRPSQALTLEIHEGAVTRAEAMRELRERLRDWNIGLAYDDFGAGQARFIELVEVRPDVLKFDMELVQGIHLASAERQNLVATLVRMARELDIVPLAEGVELPEESETCRQLGFELAQGFYFGKPAPLSP
jgi:EAL domain-containing protein (putative c-di-GMP-specific phosphodiesterase class I)